MSWELDGGGGNRRDPSIPIKPMKMSSTSPDWPFRCWWTHGRNNEMALARLRTHADYFHSIHRANPDIRPQDYFCGEKFDQSKSGERLGSSYVINSIEDVLEDPSRIFCLFIETANGAGFGKQSRRREELLAIAVWRKGHSVFSSDDLLKQISDKKFPDHLKWIFADHIVEETKENLDQEKKLFDKMNTSETLSLQQLKDQNPEIADYRPWPGQSEQDQKYELLHKLDDIIQDRLDTLRYGRSDDLKRAMELLKEYHEDGSMYIDLLCTTNKGRGNGFGPELIFLLGALEHWNGIKCNENFHTLSLQALDVDSRGPVFQLYERLGAETVGNSGYQKWNPVEVCNKLMNCRDSNPFRCRKTTDGFKIGYNIDIDNNCITYTTERHIQGIDAPEDPIQQMSLEQSLQKLSISSPAVPQRVASTRGVRTYVDNPQNRRLNRVGLPYGSPGRSPVRQDTSRTRPSPSIHASHAKDQIKVGGDGNLWISQTRGRGQPYRWYRHHKEKEVPVAPRFVPPPVAPRFVPPSVVPTFVPPPVAPRFVPPPVAPSSVINSYKSSKSDSFNQAMNLFI